VRHALTLQSFAYADRVVAEAESGDGMGETGLDTKRAEIGENFGLFTWGYWCRCLCHLHYIGSRRTSAKVAAVNVVIAPYPSENPNGALVLRISSGKLRLPIGDALLAVRSVR